MNTMFFCMQESINALHNILFMEIKNIENQLQNSSVHTPKSIPWELNRLLHAVMNLQLSQPPQKHQDKGGRAGGENINNNSNNSNNPDNNTSVSNKRKKKGQTQPLIKPIPASSAPILYF